MSATRVAVVGAGPTGLLLAGELALAGVSAIVLERLEGPRTSSPGIAINISAAELLDLRGLLDPLRPGSPPLPAAHFGMIWLGLAHLADEHEHGYVVPQTRVEGVLAARAAELGVEIRYGHELVALSQDDDGVTVEVRGGGGTYTLDAAYVVGADGPESAVRELTGIKHSSTEEPFYGLVADVRAEFAGLPPGLLGSSRQPDGGVYTGAPSGPGLLRVMTAEFGRSTPHPAAPVPFRELQASVLRVAGALLPETEVLWARRFPLVTELADAYHRGRVLLAGDAAHLFPAFGGERLNTCFDDAVNLGWKLAAVLAGTAPAGLLDTYQAERLPAGTTAAAVVQAQVALGHPAETVAPLRELLTRLVRIPEVNRELVDLVTGLGVRYPLPEEPSDTVGFRLTPAQLTALTPVADALRRGRGVLVHPGQGWLDALDGDWTDLLDVIEVADPPTGLGGATLIRPDGRVAAADPAGADPDQVRRALHTWFGDPTPGQ